MLKGQFSELAGFMQKLKKMGDAPREIAIQLAPVVSSLVDETFAAQTSPTGDPWPATKSGAPAFGGGASLGHVLSRLVGKSTIRTTVLYPLHFHQDGTRAVGRKKMAAIKRGVIGTALKSLGFKGISAPRRRKGESDEAYAKRLEKVAAAKELRDRAAKELKGSAQAAADAARDASGWHDPPRPMIPDEDAAIPDRWMKEIREVSRYVMTLYGAEERG